LNGLTCQPLSGAVIGDTVHSAILYHFQSTIIDVLKKQIGAPLLGEIPYLPRAEQRDLTRYLDLSRAEEAVI